MYVASTAAAAAATAFLNCSHLKTPGEKESMGCEQAYVQLATDVEVEAIIILYLCIYKY